MRRPPLLLGVLLAGCAVRAAAVQLRVPAPQPGRVKVVAQAAAPLGSVQPFAVAAPVESPP